MATHETVQQLFVDIRTAYDSYRRKVLYNTLTEFGIPIQIVRLIKMVLMNPKGQSEYVNFCLAFFNILRTVLGAKLYLYCVHISVHVRLV